MSPERTTLGQSGLAIETPDGHRSKSPRSIISRRRSIEAGSLVAPSPRWAVTQSLIEADAANRSRGHPGELLHPPRQIHIRISNSGSEPALTAMECIDTSVDQWL